jgi:AcrR family transcriptional regulator
MTEHAATDGRTARRDRNRLAVLDAVLDLFAEGNLSPSPEAVAQRSGISLRSVYRYVAHSDDLVRAAIDRHLEKVGPLFTATLPDQGPFTSRVEAFVTGRLRLYEAVAPTARAARLRAQLRSTPASDLIASRLDVRRRLLRRQLERQFAAEIAGLGALADPLVAAADGLSQLETIDWYRTAGGCTAEQTQRVLVAGLGRLLGSPG